MSDFRRVVAPAESAPKASTMPHEDQHHMRWSPQSRKAQSDARPMFFRGDLLAAAHEFARRRAGDEPGNLLQSPTLSLAERF